MKDSVEKWLTVKDIGEQGRIATKNNIEGMIIYTYLNGISVLTTGSDNKVEVLCRVNQVVKKSKEFVNINNIPIGLPFNFRVIEIANKETDQLEYFMIILKIK
ncbi:hypothetical protein H311_02005 [Anncaliia algerae PRA109]|nr:hypothetical protein H311_02005 [Anncaliia algerae PRA109]